ncbi:hypothetical protein Trco_006440 [Trichoderma cornu-damae]|uniref:Uncharacterized protein n=1 Tax=Trichoderma cornu-damae TaxID=654480 RepID=A0A9P8TTX1_9HYPO|nr:hypothetical protein Trco_006440 [Trichoderma cornu-damae]
MAPDSADEISTHAEPKGQEVSPVENEMETRLKKLNDRITDRLNELETRIHGIQQQMNVKESQMDDVNVQINMLNIVQIASEYNARARDQNSLVTSKEMHLCPLRNPSTNIDVHCPNTLAELEALQESELDVILEALGEPFPRSFRDKKEILKWAMGVRTGLYGYKV